MNLADLIVIIILTGIVLLAFRSLARQRKNGFGCSGSCAGCMQKCGTPETAAEREKSLRKKRAERGHLAEISERTGADLPAQQGRTEQGRADRP